MLPNVAMIWPQQPIVWALLIVGIGSLIACRSRLRGTTLIASWWWCVISLVCVGGVELWVGTMAGTGVPSWTVHLQFAAAATTFCPVMAQLGAKRPQNKAWQFIVVSLWVVVVLPAGEALLYSPDSPLDLHAARRWFLVLLVGLGLANTLPTRYWPSSLLYALAQLLLFAGHLPWAPPHTTHSWNSVALGSGVAALVLWSMGVPCAAQPVTDVDRWWRDFRDSYGLLWGLRVADRFNAAAHMYAWPVRLKWRGLELDQDVESYEQLDPQQRDTIERVLLTLLRRFVSDEWIVQRGA